MAATSSISGLISGLKTDDIISKMMELAKRPQNQLLNEKSEDQTKLATWQDLNTRIYALNAKIGTLATSSAFTQCQATSSDYNVLQPIAGTDATPGTYYLTVKNRAQGHQIAAQSLGPPAAPFTSTTADVGTGKVSFSFTNAHNKDFNINIDSTNNTLTGLRDAINKANKGVQASIVNAGSASSPAYQLVLSSDDTGLASQFTVSGEAGIKVDFSNVIQQGTPAQITLGGGGGSATPITMYKDTNSFTDLIPGVTLNIMTPDASKTIKVEVTRNTSVIKSSIQDFVQQYNDLSDAINAQFKYDSTSGTGGALLGDWDLQSVQMTLSSIVGGYVEGVDSHFSALAAIGITQDVSGHLQIDNEELTDAVTNHLSDISRLFSANMTSDSSYISYVTSTADTAPSPTTGWDVNITQAASQAQVTATVAMTGVLTTDESLTVYSDSGTSKTIKMSALWSLSRVITEINNNTGTTGVAAVATKADGTVSEDSGENLYLSLKSVRYGASGKVTAYSNISNASGITTGIGIDPLTEKSPTGQAGLDVAGTINGEACKGLGQILTANPAVSKSPIKGLSLKITSPSAISSKVYFTKGLGTKLRDTIIDMTSLDGILTKSQKTLTDRMTELDKDIADMQTKLDDQSDKLYAQFNAMESQLAKLQQQGDYLSQQFAAMNKSS